MIQAFQFVDGRAYRLYFVAGQSMDEAGQLAFEAMLLYHSIFRLKNTSYTDTSMRRDSVLSGSFLFVVWVK